MQRVEISPASVTQVLRSQRGVRIAVDDDVQSIARELREVRETLVLEYVPAEDIWLVSDRQRLPNGEPRENLVTTWDVAESGPLDYRLVQRVREISSPDYNFADEIERAEREDEARNDHEFREKIGDGSERLAHALVKDLGLGGNRAFVPRSVPR